MSSGTVEDLARPSPGSTSSLRVANLHRVIKVLQEAPAGNPVTQADIARATKLAPATVSNIVRELHAAGFVDTTAGAGRRGTAVRISRGAGLVVGIDFGHQHLRVAISDLAGAILAETSRQLASSHACEEGLELATTLRDELLEGLAASPDAVLAIGLGLPAPIGADGLVVSSSILPGWVGVKADAVATERFGKPVIIDNDANLGALAEHRRGAGIGHPCMVYVKVSSGVGAGIIIDGRLFRGGGGTAGEIGHLTLNDSGPVCRCGNRGCLEAYTSVTTVKDLLAVQHPNASFAEIVAAARVADTASRRVIEDAGRQLGWGLAMVSNLLNPTCLVVGGDMAQAGDMLLDAIRTGLRRYALGSLGATVELRTALLGDRAPVLGAVLLALDHVEPALP
ncbi:MAG: ROK family transcriptional regulator [Nocardioidaceae bacterium]